MQFQFQTIEDLKDVSKKTAIVLVDLNEPIVNGFFEDDFRIKKSLDTILFLLGKGSRVLLISHFGSEKDLTIEPVSVYLNKFFPTVFAKDLETASELLKEETTSVVLLENIRMFPGEKENSEVLAKNIANLGDFYVNEGFSVSHRSHASVTGLPKFLPSYAGLNFKEEVKHLSMVFNPPKPFILVLSGKKSETKIPLLKNFIDLADKVFVGGALANDFLKAKGYNIGESVSSKEISIDSSWLNNEKIILPEDCTAVLGGEKFENIKISDVKDGYKIFDVGEGFCEKFKEESKKAKFIVWNGSMGFWEGGFKRGTESFANSILESGAFSIVGGGDTVMALSEMNLREKFSFVSTGGGAMLDFLCDGKLPGIDSLENSAKIFSKS
jgi:phosphoglycerate kinase